MTTKTASDLATITAVLTAGSGTEKRIMHDAEFVGFRGGRFVFREFKGDDTIVTHALNDVVSVDVDGLADNENTTEALGDAGMDIHEDGTVVNAF